MRWRRNQCHTRCGMSGLCNPRINFLCRQVSAFAWLCTLCHLNLNFLCGGQVFRSDTEPSRGNLLDGRTFINGTTRSDDSFQIFAAFTAVGLAADAVHCHCHAFVCFLRNRTIGHCTRLEPPHNAFDALDFFQRNAAVVCKPEVQCAPQCYMLVLFI